MANDREGAAHKSIRSTKAATSFAKPTEPKPAMADSKADFRRANAQLFLGVLAVFFAG
ncbi:MAG: hypothetical protein O3A00_18305 [Planctomycetota bacterium]|nr:hypothetical protein [Planctomycetota bacterium]